MAASLINLLPVSPWTCVENEQRRRELTDRLYLEVKCTDNKLMVSVGLESGTFSTDTCPEATL